MKEKQLLKLSLAASLTALSVVLDVLLKQIISSDQFGIPLFAVPLIVGSYLLGPIYGMMMGLISDTAGFLLAPNGSYLPLFALSAMAWGALPSLFANFKRKPLTITLSIFLTHITATFLNSIALYTVFSSFDAWMKLFYLRVVMIPVNTVWLTILFLLMKKRIIILQQTYLNSQNPS